MAAAYIFILASFETVLVLTTATQPSSSTSTMDGRTRGAVKVFY